MAGVLLMADNLCKPKCILQEEKSQMEDPVLTKNLTLFEASKTLNT